jgi:transposase InsO family protein
LFTNWRVCVERRFGTNKTPHVVEWLSDNGFGLYRDKDTLDTATALGLQLCVAPVRSPWNRRGVRQNQRDYARLSIMPDAATVIALLAAWFEDYNEVHPRTGLKFLSLKEFLGLSAQRNQAVCTVKRGSNGQS